jgi:trehalose-6-phosphatase
MDKLTKSDILPEKMRAIIVDLDGTLAIFENRRKYYEYDKIELDEVRESVKEIMRLYFTAVGTVIILTGRPKESIKQTLRWLTKNDIYYHHIFFRKDTDDRHDYIVKKEFYEREIKPFYHIDFVLDDRNLVVKMWRDLGLDCFQIELTDY